MIWIILLALALRIPPMFSSLWLDEAIEATALMGRQGPLLKYALSDFQPPIYHFILYAWTRLAGFSEVALRTPSLISGLLTVYFVYKIGVVLKDKRTGIIASLLTATNPLLIYYSVEGRTYMMTAFFVTASFYYLLVLLKNPQSSRSTTSYLLSTIGALWSSYLAWLVVALQFAYLIWQKRWDLARYTFFAALTLLLWLPSFISSLGIGVSTAGNSPEWGRVVGGLSVKAVTLTWVKLVIGRIGFDSRYLYGVVMLLLGALHTFILSKINKLTPVLITWLASIILAVIIALFLPVYSYFRLLFIVPAYLIILALGLRSLSPKFTWLIILVNLSFIFIFYFSPRYHHEDWRKLVSDIQSNPGAVAMPSIAQSAPLSYYELGRPVFEPQEGISTTEKRIYYIKYVEDLFDINRLGPANLVQAGYTIVESRTYPGLELNIYEKN